jgi:hypothetical protein
VGEFVLGGVPEWELTHRIGEELTIAKAKNVFLRNEIGLTLGMPMSDRSLTPSPVEAHVLMASARRCALCFGFDGNLERQKGQIAHIDQDRTNADEANLVYLCLVHHDEYDSRTSQVKGITAGELRGYKERLISAISSGQHLLTKPQSPDIARSEAIRGHDERLFRQADEILAERFLTDVLDVLQSDDSYRMSHLRKIDSFRSFFSETGNQFIGGDLSTKLAFLIESIDALLLFLARSFFVYPNHQSPNEDLRLCMYPELNVDRNGIGSVESVTKYAAFQRQLDDAVRKVRATYKDYRLAINDYLLL